MKALEYQGKRERSSLRAKLNTQISLPSQGKIGGSAKLIHQNGSYFHFLAVFRLKTRSAVYPKH